MQVVLARSAGFCLGVSLALKHLDRELERFTEQGEQGRLATFGPIIHNPLVMQWYESRGVLCVDEPAGIRRGDRVVIRAHGIPKETEQELRDAGAEIIDATCPKVKKAQKAIAGVRGRNARLLLFGEREHPEVRGLLSYAGEGAQVFGSLAELETLEFDWEQGGNGKYFLAAQTTQDRKTFERARQWLDERLRRSIKTLDTICNATRDRQQGVMDLLDRVDAMVVVGGYNSGNTRRLAEVAQAGGLPSVHVEQAGDISAEQMDLLRRALVVGLTAGASTPRAHIEAMQEFLTKIEQ